MTHWHYLLMMMENLSYWKLTLEAVCQIFPIFAKLSSIEKCWLIVFRDFWIDRPLIASRFCYSYNLQVHNFFCLIHERFLNWLQGQTSRIILTVVFTLQLIIGRMQRNILSKILRRKKKNNA